MKTMEINCETGEEIIREATKAEKDDVKLRQAEAEATKAEAEAKTAQRQAILDKLELTADEARLLLG